MGPSLLRARARPAFDPASSPFRSRLDGVANCPNRPKSRGQSCPFVRAAVRAPRGQPAPTAACNPRPPRYLRRAPNLAARARKWQCPCRNSAGSARTAIFSAALFSHVTPVPTVT